MAAWKQNMLNFCFKNSFDSLSHSLTLFYEGGNLQKKEVSLVLRLIFTTKYLISGCILVGLGADQWKLNVLIISLNVQASGIPLRFTCRLIHSCVFCWNEITKASSATRKFCHNSLLDPSNTTTNSPMYKCWPEPLKIWIHATSPPLSSLWPRNDTFLWLYFPGLSLATPFSQIYLGLWGYNSSLSCAAIGGMFLALTWQTHLLAMACGRYPAGSHLPWKWGRMRRDLSWQQRWAGARWAPQAGRQMDVGEADEWWGWVLEPRLSCTLCFHFWPRAVFKERAVFGGHVLTEVFEIKSALFWVISCVCSLVAGWIMGGFFPAVDTGSNSFFEEGHG